MTLNIKSIIPALLVPSTFMVFLLSAAAFPLGFSVQEGRVVSSILGLVIAFGILSMVIRVERASFREYQLFFDKGTFKRFLKGFLLSLILGGMMILTHALYSGLKFTPNFKTWDTFLLMSITLIPLAFMEELIFRSFLLIKLQNTCNIWITQCIISILFTLYHVVGMHGQSLISAFVGPGIWSFIFVILAIRSKGVAMPTGFHYGLNLLLGALGSKDWIPGLWTVDFEVPPSPELLADHETFGCVLHSLLLVFAILGTFYLQKRMSEIKTQPS